MSSISDPDGRYVIVKCEVDNRELVIVSVYLPSQLTLSNFSDLITKIAGMIQTMDSENVIWCGDFNLVLNHSLDTKKGTHHRADAGVRLNSLMEAHELTDVWRAFNPHTKRYTCFNKTTSTLSRIDYALASPSFLTAITDMSIGATYQSDHSPLHLSFCFDNENRGWAHWKFPNFLVHNHKLKGHLVALIQDLQKLNVGTDPAVLWDTIKAAIRGEAIKFLGEVKQKKCNQIESLEQEIAQAVFDHDQADSVDMVYHYQSKTDRLQIELDETYTSIDAQTFAYRKARKHYEFGKPTQYFL